MAKLHWTPWMALSELRVEPERMAAEAAVPKEAGYVWQPAADVVETPVDFRVMLELPGVCREDVTVEARGRYLVIQGDRPFARDAGEGLYQVLERSYGPFSRRFALPRGVARSEIRAVMKDGLLVIVVPKVGPERLHRRIPIS
ncbi:heat shock protein Hsp20 [Solidesulfovibrio carbinoliphilus subsp. oakridgensis]|uniref:Heat shock protein Hsp20 n=1 Tax=Solidesulfovibrio carbinoliphilus subsp. oakridgensis TaxID=694327 RepID=G7Q825_9BACT|nr:HSP20 family small heat-shock protein [Solidesulfovibrio carbinoliphilus]EHJ47719.1 heat shock protein Hsp20 [Solidesulfovibrio carbinoliphilus subsp. oakridgensis]